jgi:hypothetical protein
MNAPAVQRLVSSTTIKDAEAIANHLLELGRISEIEAFLLDRSLAPQVEA